MCSNKPIISVFVGISKIFDFIPYRELIKNVQKYILIPTHQLKIDSKFNMKDHHHLLKNKIIPIT